MYHAVVVGETALHEGDGAGTARWRVGEADVGACDEEVPKPPSASAVSRRSGLLLHKSDLKGPNFAIEVTSTTTYKMRQLRENIVPAVQEAGIPHLAIYVRMDRPVHSSFRRDLPAGVTLLETDQQLIAWIESVSGMEPTE